MGRSHWLRGLSSGSAAARFLGLRVRIPPGAWMSVSCECGVSSHRSLCVGLITRPEESYRVWCVHCVIAKPHKGGCDPESGRSATKKSQLNVSGSGKGPVAGNRRSGLIKGMDVLTSWVTVSWSSGNIFLGVFAKLPKATNSVVMFVHTSVRMEELGSYWTDFHEIWYSSIVRKWFKNYGHVAWRPVYIFIIYRSYFLRMRNFSDKTYSSKVTNGCNCLFF
jgi:hypothetical protein